MATTTNTHPFRGIKLRSTEMLRADTYDLTVAIEESPDPTARRYARILERQIIAELVGRERIRCLGERLIATIESWDDEEACAETERGAA